MSFPDDEWASGKQARVCGDKHRFSSRSDAKRGIKRVCQQVREARNRWRAYRCPYCNFFHIGHRTEKYIQLNTITDAIVASREKHRHVRIPASVDEEAAALSVHSPNDQRRWAKRSMNALRALDLYGAAKNHRDHPFNGNFYTFCQFSQAAPVPLSAIKLNESPLLLNDEKLRQQRMFTVDPALDPSGWRLMESHLHVQKRGNPAPRIYFYDDTRGPTGLVHIGYIGKHLDNTHTAKSM